MKRLSFVSGLLLILAACGQTTSPTAAPGPAPTLGSYHDGGGFSRFYGEELHDNRVYLFGSQSAYDKFIATKSPNPLGSKTYMGIGAKTIVVEQDKEAPAMEKRLIATYKERYSLN